jgi:hypothetical protein
LVFLLGVFSWQRGTWSYLNMESHCFLANYVLFVSLYLFILVAAWCLFIFLFFLGLFSRRHHSHWPHKEDDGEWIGCFQVFWF